MINQELKALRNYIAYFDNSPGREPPCTRSEIQEALRPILAALEKLADSSKLDSEPTHLTPKGPPAAPDGDGACSVWIDLDGDEWTRGESYHTCVCNNRTYQITDVAREFEKAWEILWP